MVRGFVLALVFLVSPAFGQNLPAQTDDFLNAVKSAAEAQAALDEGQTSPAFLALLKDKTTWMNPSNKPGLGEVFRLFSLFGATDFAMADPQWAADAARVAVRVKMRETAGFDWTLHVDFIRIDNQWLLRALDLEQRRPLAVSAQPEEVISRWLADLQQAAGRRNLEPDKSWLRQALDSHWSFGGGYWQRADDCVKAARATCLTAKAAAAALWVKAILDREKSIVLESFTPSDETPQGVILVEIPRRTMVSRQQYKVTLARDRRFGWQIASLEPIGEATETPAVEIAANTDSGADLVRSLLDALMGDDAPSAAALLANPETVLPYFTDTREGRKARARLISLTTMAGSMGAKSHEARIENLGENRLQISFDDPRLAVFSPIIAIQNDAGGALIAGIENQ
jgi:hypothetical protein